MGCDIHVVVEYATSDDEWWSLASGLMLPRDYGIFARLAGVRGDGPAPKGLPNTCSCAVEALLHVYVRDEYPSDMSQHKINGGVWIIRSKAEQLVQEGVTKYTSESKHWIFHPECHSHSWATLGEWEAAVAQDPETPWEYQSVTCLLKLIEAQGWPGRVVYWFDN